MLPQRCSIIIVASAGNTPTAQAREKPSYALARRQQSHTRLDIASVAVSVAVVRSLWVCGCLRVSPLRILECSEGR